MGGAQNYRMGLWDAAMIKDNHVAVAGGVGPAVARARAAGLATIICEVDELAQIEPALAAGATHLLIDPGFQDSIAQNTSAPTSLIVNTRSWSPPRRGTPRGRMKVKRIIANLSAPEPSAVDKFYHGILGLDLAMDHGWIRTYAGPAKMAVQVSFASQGGSGTPVPDLSIEVDDLDEALRRVRSGEIPVEYGPVSEPWGVRRFYVRDPVGRLINILQHE